MNTFDEIIQTKAYGDLSSSELEIIQELVSSEEEYNEMKSFYAEIDQLALSNREDVSASVKTSLNSVFQAKHPGISQNWSTPVEEVAEKKIIPLYNRPLFRVAALLVLSAGITTIWFSLSDEQLTKSNSSKITASTDSVSHEEAPQVQEKKKFPLNEGNEKEFTAASTIPADKNVEQKMTIYSNAVPTTYTTVHASGDEGSAAVPLNTYKLSTSAVSGSKKQDNWNETEKREGKKEDLVKAGLAADLNPGGFYNESVKDYKPSIKTSDYLTLIEPSF